MDISRRVFAGVSNIFLGLLISPTISADFSLLHFLLSIHLKSISIFRIGCPSWRNSLRSSSSPGVILSAAGSCFLLACDWSSCSGHDAPREVCPQGCGSSMAAPARTRPGSGWDARRATWIPGKWSIGWDRSQNNLAQERIRSRCAKCLVGYVVVWNLLVGHLFIYLAGTFFLSESYSFIYWSVPF